jgi:hypothetical protein
MTAKPSDAVAEEQDTFAKALVDGGVWSKRDVIWLFAQQYNSDGEADINWKNPGSHDVSPVSDPGWTPFIGYDGGSPDYINTNFNPATDGDKFKLNDASVSMYHRIEIATTQIPFGIKNGSYGIQYLPYYLGNRSIRINGANSLQWADSSQNKGFTYIERSASNARAMFLNNSELGSDSEVSTAIPNLDMYIFARNNDGTPDLFCNTQVSYFAMGGALSAAERLAEMNAIEAYMDSNGKGVLS